MPQIPAQANSQESIEALRRDVDAIAPVSPAVGGPAQGSIATPSPLLLPGEATLARRAKFALVNACTIASILLGLSAVFLAANQEIRLAALLVLGCVVLDGADGGLARRLDVASPFGAQMDSLADMCSFSLATPVVVFFWMHGGGVPLPVLGPVCALVTVCGAIRLARFNVSPRDGHYFTGVPTTIAAAIMAITVLLNPDPHPVALMLTIVAGLAVLMVSSFPYAKLAQIVQLPPWLWVLPLVGLFIDASGVFAVLVVGYLLSGPLLWVRRRQDARA